jgi:hypothetical protein
VARDLPNDHPDVVADRRFRSANRWPSGLPGFREVVVDYRNTMERLAQKLVRLYARALGPVGGIFRRPFKEPQYKLRTTHYPHYAAMPEDEFGIAPRGCQFSHPACPQRRTGPLDPYAKWQMDRHTGHSRRLCGRRGRGCPRVAAPSADRMWLSGHQVDASCRWFRDRPSLARFWLRWWSPAGNSADRRGQFPTDIEPASAEGIESLRRGFAGQPRELFQLCLFHALSHMRRLDRGSYPIQSVAVRQLSRCQAAEARSLRRPTRLPPRSCRSRRGARLFR